nr:uncharacterized protein LOC122271740 [Parasteatoda tepidariorum]
MCATKFVRLIFDENAFASSLKKYLKPSALQEKPGVSPLNNKLATKLKWKLKEVGSSIEEITSHTVDDLVHPHSEPASSTSSVMCQTPKRPVDQRVITPKTRKIKRLSSKLYLKRKLENQPKCSSLDVKSILSVIQPLVTPSIYHFIKCQLLSCNVSKYGRRWSVSDKNLCLQLYLASPKSYRLLRKFLNLPNKSTLLKAVSGIKLEPGFLTAVLNSMMLIASKLKPRERICIVSFDEMSLKPGLTYEKHKGKSQVLKTMVPIQKKLPNLQLNSCTWFYGTWSLQEVETGCWLFFFNPNSSISHSENLT